MRKFPTEYLYIDKTGKMFHKEQYKRKRELDEFSVYFALNKPVVFNKDFGLHDLFKFIEANPIAKAYAVGFEEFFKEFNTPVDPELEMVDYTHFNFNWDALNCDKDDLHKLPMLSITGKVEGKYENYSLSFIPMNAYPNVKFKFDYELKVVKDWQEEDVMTSTFVFPTLCDVINAFFWEASWFGLPERRNEQAAELAQAVVEVREGTAELTSADELFAQLKGKNDE